MSVDLLDGLLTVFISYPLLAVAIGLGLLLLGRWSRRRVVVAAGVAWLYYGIYELGMQQRLLCSGECNIRIDLLVIHPLLLLALIAAVVSMVRAATSAARS